MQLEYLMLSNYYIMSLSPCRVPCACYIALCGDLNYSSRMQRHCVISRVDGIIQVLVNFCRILLIFLLCKLNVFSNLKTLTNYASLNKFKSD